MYHVHAQGVDEHMINVHYYYCKLQPDLRPVPHFRFRGRLEIVKERHSP